MTLIRYCLLRFALEKFWKSLGMFALPRDDSHGNSVRNLAVARRRNYEDIRMPCGFS